MRYNYLSPLGDLLKFFFVTEQRFLDLLIRINIGKKLFLWFETTSILGSISKQKLSNWITCFEPIVSLSISGSKEIMKSFSKFWFNFSLYCEIVLFEIYVLSSFVNFPSKCHFFSIILQFSPLEPQLYRFLRATETALNLATDLQVPFTQGPKKSQSEVHLEHLALSVSHDL